MAEKKKKERKRKKVVSSDIDVNVKLQVEGAMSGVLGGAGGAPGPGAVSLPSFGGAPAEASLKAQEARMAKQDRRLDLSVENLEAKVDREKLRQEYESKGLPFPGAAADPEVAKGKKILNTLKNIEKTVESPAEGLRIGGALAQGVAAATLLKTSKGRAVLGAAKKVVLPLAIVAAGAKFIEGALPSILANLDRATGMDIFQRENPVAGFISDLFARAASLTTSPFARMKMESEFQRAGADIPPGMLSFIQERDYRQRRLQSSVDVYAARFRFIRGVLGD